MEYEATTSDCSTSPIVEAFTTGGGSAQQVYETFTTNHCGASQAFITAGGSYEGQSFVTTSDFSASQAFIAASDCNVKQPSEEVTANECTSLVKVFHGWSIQSEGSTLR